MERPIRTPSILLGIWGQKLPVKPRHTNCAIQIPAQQPRIEIDVLNLGSAGDLMIFRPMAFVGITPILTFSTEIF